MITVTAARELWYSGRPIVGVRFSANDPVEVCEGVHVGAEGAVISLEGLTPEPEYVVELGSGDDVLLPQSFLRLVG